MPPTPLYDSADLQCAYQLRYGWTAWPSEDFFQPSLIDKVLHEISAEWEKDGMRALEHAASRETLQITFSAKPNVSPTKLAARAKGRIQHHYRKHDPAFQFSRKLAVRSLGDVTSSQVEAYIRNQVCKEPLADERYRAMLKSFTVINPEVDLVLPTESGSGRYWYNLHLVLVTAERHRCSDEVILGRIRDTIGHVCKKKRYAASSVAVMPDHVHMGLRGGIDQSPEEIALAFLNNLAFALGQRPWFESGYYAGTFGEYGMGAVRGMRREEEKAG